MRPIFLMGVVLSACASAPSSPAPSIAKTAAAAPIVDAGIATAKADPCADDSFGLPRALEAEVAARFEKKRGTMGAATKQIVATSHPLATEAALAVLHAGGNAADAFVTAVLVDDVVFPGVTSTAGLTGVLVYQAKTKQITYVHGGLADPIDPARRYRPGDSALGKTVLVPGAPAAYAAIVKRFGKKSLATAVEPAAKLATQGFAIDALYARSIKSNRAKLERSAYGKRIFFHDGVPLAEGEILKQVELGTTLRGFGKDPNFFYDGAWARDAVALANNNGGAFTVQDFHDYAPEIASPLQGRFLDYDLYAAGYGGVKVLASLQAFQALRAPGATVLAPSRSADALELLLRVQRAAHDLPMIRDRALVMRGSAANDEVAKAATEIAARVHGELAASATASPNEPGTHSSAVVVIDAEGNIVVGTHTIETLNWGEGFFVGGVPLSTAGASGFDDATKAATRVRIDPLSSTIVMKDGAPVAALTVYGTGLHPADVQILDAVLARGLDAEAAVLEPRVGYFSYDLAQHKIDVTKTSVDPRFSIDLLCALKQRGFQLERAMPGMPAGYVDTGFPTLVTIAPGELHGMTPDMPHIHGVAKGD